MKNRSKQFSLGNSGCNFQGLSQAHLSTCHAPVSTLSSQSKNPQEPCLLRKPIASIPMLDPNSIRNGTVCSGQSQYQLKRFPINWMPSLLSCHHPELQCFISAHKKFQAPVERCLAGLIKRNQTCLCFPVGWRVTTSSGRQLALDCWHLGVRWPWR